MNQITFTSYFKFSFCYLIMGCSCIFFYGCEPLNLNTDELTDEKPYFDLAGFIEQQILILDSIDTEAQVEAVVNQETENKIIEGDSTFWAEALGFLKESDINVPNLRGRYQVSDSLAPDGSKITSYQASQKGLNIVYLNVKYGKDSENVRQIETFFQDRNLLYSTERKIKVLFSNLENEPRLAQYEVKGTQKMILKDSITYQDRITVLYKN